MSVNGGVLGVASFPTTPAGHAELIGWMQRFGLVARVGVEGTGSWGVGLARYLHRGGVDVIEVDRPNRQARRRDGKSDQLDAVEAARAALSGRAAGRAKTADGNVAAIRALMVARRSGRETRVRCLVQLRHLGFCGPDQLREQFRGASVEALVRGAAQLRPGHGGHDVVIPATKLAMRTLARRIQGIDADNTCLDGEVERLVTATAPSLLTSLGVGPHTAALLLCAVGDNSDRVRSEAAFAQLCGVAPIPASSGKTTRYRLNRGGDRHANHALWRIVITRISCDDRTRSYLQRRLAEGRTKPEIIRMLKRYVAREVYPHLVPPSPAATPATS